VEGAFYEPAGQYTYVATAATVGPWSPDAQHGGPPSALAARALELHEPDERQRLARVAIDILRPVPVGKLTLRTRTIRAGRRITLAETVMDADGQDVLYARGWRIERQAQDVPEIVDGVSAHALPPASEGDPPPIFGRAAGGYLASIEWRFLLADFTIADPATAVTSGPEPRLAQVRSAWARPRVPLVADDQVSPMARTLLVADSGSGVGAALPPTRFIFINVDLAVVLPRDPVGDWLLLEAETVIGSEGTGLAMTRLSDQAGPCGRAWQTLLVAPQ